MSDFGCAEPIETDDDRLDIVIALARITARKVAVRHSAGIFAAIFDRDYYEANFGQGPSVESGQPAFTARTSDVQQLVKDTPLQIDGEPDPYYVKRHQPDGTGMSVVLLKR